jgi:hypothetical protein
MRRYQCRLDDVIAAHGRVIEGAFLSLLIAGCDSLDDGDSSMLSISKSRFIRFMAVLPVCCVGIALRSIFQSQAGCQDALPRRRLNSREL